MSRRTSALLAALLCVSLGLVASQGVTCPVVEVSPATHKPGQRCPADTLLRSFMPFSPLCRKPTESRITESAERREGAALPEALATGASGGRGSVWQGRCKAPACHLHSPKLA